MRSDENDLAPNSEIAVSEVVLKNEGRPKRGRKRKIPSQSRADRKRLLNNNKTHFNTRGQLVEEKVFNETFTCRCPKKCTDVVSLGLRRKLFSQFWSLGTFKGRCAFIICCVKEIPKLRTYTKVTSKRVITRKYSIFGRDVCKIAFLKTLQITQSRVDTALKKQNCDSFADGRGQSSGGRKAFPPEIKQEVIAHIASFPKYVSHYTRAQTNSKFLSSELNLAKIFELFKVDHMNLVSFSYYRRIFYENFNLRFKVPKKDTCLQCDKYQVKLNDCSTETERLEIEQCHNDHLDHADALRCQMNADLQLSKTDIEVETLPFDMQKTYALPKLPTNIVYYKRQLNYYNLGIHVGSINKGIFNVWLETQASKGTQEVGSCLRKYIFDNIKPPVKKLFLWSDSCGGQNRSIKLVLMLIHTLQNHTSLESISLRFLQSGHSFLPNDSEFGDVECFMKQFESLYTDADIIDKMKRCRNENKFEVNTMLPEEFVSVKDMERAITNRKVDIHKNKVNWLQTHEILILKSEPTKIRMRRKLSDVFQVVNIEKRTVKSELKTIKLERLWPQGHPISNAKKSDLLEMLPLIPQESKDFYKFLTTIDSAEFMDDIDGFGESIDFEMED